MVREIPAPGNVIHVRDRLLASALLMVGVPLKTDLVGGETWAGMTNIYSAKNPARVNNVRVPGVETYYFSDRAPNGVMTKTLVEAWHDASKLRDGEQPQGIRELNRINRELRRNGLSEEARNALLDEADKWQCVSHIQGAVITLMHNRNLSALMVDANALQPKAKDFLIGKTRYMNLEKSRL